MIAPRRLVLWDIDQTLIDGGTETHSAYAAAFHQATGAHLVQPWQFDGRTELAAAGEVLRVHGFDPAGGLLETFLDLIVAALQQRAPRMAATGRVLPGAAEALAAAGRTPGMHQSVLTGNLYPLAVLKLTTFGLDTHLDLRIGAYGGDAVERADLPRHALEPAGTSRPHTPSVPKRSGWPPAPPALPSSTPPGPTSFYPTSPTPQPSCTRSRHRGPRYVTDPPEKVRYGFRHRHHGLPRLAEVPRSRKLPHRRLCRPLRLTTLGPMKFSDPQVILFVADTERAASFYSVFGFRETFRAPQKDPVKVEMALGGFNLGLALPQFMAESHGLEPVTAGHRACIAIWTDDVDAAYRLSLSSGATDSRSPYAFWEGRFRIAFVEDPDGYPVQLVQKVG